MKKLFLLTLIIVAASCAKETPKTAEDNLKEVFETHGGLDAWKSAKILSFNKGEEVHTVDLQTRKTVVNHPNYSLGFDGNEVWLAQDSIYFKGNPTFYYNLYFYFYAMPFVLADDGIIYEKTDSITFEEVTYPGIKVSYEANVGTSPDDNYILYYHPETKKMEWLAYTVTFRSKKPSDKYNIIKYDEWETVNGLLLPKSIVWYKKDENGNPTEPAGTPTNFSLPLISKASLADGFFEKPKEETE